MSINAVITLTGDDEAGLYLHTHGDIGAVSGFIEEAKQRFVDGDFIISNYIAGDNVKVTEARTSFYATFFGVVREYLAYYARKATKNICTVKMYSTGVTTSPLVYKDTPIMRINNDFTCDYIDTLIFSDNDIKSLEKVRAFFQRSHEVMSGIYDHNNAIEREKKGYFYG